MAIFALLLILGSRCPAQALSVAVFPVDDLSAAYNSESRAMTEFLRQEVAQRGLAVVQAEAVSSFMAARRIRQLGVLQTQEVLAARSELQADLILLGAVCQQDEASATIGMTISLLRTSDARTLWTSSKGVSLLDEQRLLGIKAPTTMADLRPILAQALFASWPAEFDVTAGTAMAQTQGESIAITNNTLPEVDAASFRPKHVRAGQEVNCTIRLQGKNAPDRSTVFVKVGDRIHKASSEDGVYYQASWLGSEDKQGGHPLQVAMNATEPGSVVADLGRAPQNEVYPVTLVVEGASGSRAESYLGSYVVDNQAPEVAFKVQGKRINGVVSFRTELPVAVRFKRSEPISQWEFAVTSQQGEVLLSERGSDQPPSNFVWRGQDGKNSRAEAGIYVITLKVWDRAQNRGEVSEKVQLLAAAPGLHLTLARRQQQIQATLAALDEVSISSWRMELWSADRTMLKTYVGDSLPVRIVLPELAETGHPERIECILQVKDSLGVKVTQKIPDLLAQVVEGDQAGPAGEASRQSTGGSDSWQVDF